MTLRLLFLALGLACAPVALLAEQAAPQPPRAETAGMEMPQEVAALAEVMQIDAVIAILRDEGLDYGESLEAEMFPGQGGPRWQGIVGMIYDPGQMRARFDAAFARELAAAPEAVAAATDFFGSEQGQRLLTLELEARRALLDSVVEDAAALAWADLVAAQDPRVALIERFVAVNDLLESNVMGALNANLAFYRGMAEAGAFGAEMTESDMLAEVWAQEPQARADTEEWLYPYLALAYQPVSDADLEAYVAFSESPAGQRLNAALFAAFDAVFIDISQDLGRAVALQVQGDDI